MNYTWWLVTFLVTLLTCEVTRGASECSSDEDCSRIDATVCIDFTCQKQRQFNERCTRTIECRGNLFCSSSNLLCTCHEGLRWYISECVQCYVHDQCDHGKQCILNECVLVEGNFINPWILVFAVFAIVLFIFILKQICRGRNDSADFIMRNRVMSGLRSGVNSHPPPSNGNSNCNCNDTSDNVPPPAYGEAIANPLLYPSAISVMQEEELTGDLNCRLNGDKNESGKDVTCRLSSGH